MEQGAAPGASGAVSTPAPFVREAFIHDQLAPAEWTERLREISPVSDERGWLELVWEAGDPWRPAQRWTLYEMIHRSVVDLDEVKELEGPHPRSEGHACTSVPMSAWAARPAADYRPCLCRRKTESWRKGPCVMATLTQWKLYRRTGYVGRPFWIIQGSGGGHKHSFTEEEKIILEAENYPTDPPATGSLSYAPFDARVIRQMTRFNRLWQFQNNLEEYREAMGPGYAAYRAEAEKEFRRQFLAHVTEQLTDVGAGIASISTELDLRRTDSDYERIFDQSAQHFLETGNTLHKSRVN